MMAAPDLSRAATSQKRTRILMDVSLAGARPATSENLVSPDDESPVLAFTPTGAPFLSLDKKFRDKSILRQHR